MSRTEKLTLRTDAGEVGSVGQWLSFLDQNLCSYDLKSAISGDFGLSAQSRSFVGYTVARFCTIGGASILERTRKHINEDGQDRLCFYVPVGGQLTLSQYGRTVIYKVGSIGCLSTTEYAKSVKCVDSDILCLLLPKKFIEERVIHPENICVRAFKETAIGRLALDTLTSLSPNSAEMDDEQFVKAAILTGELIVHALRYAPDLETVDRSVRSANLARAKRIIRSHCSEFDISVPDIAAKCGLSVSYLHKLFRDDGRTVWEYLTAMRMYNAHDMATRRDGTTKTVTEIALMCGYSNISQFSTAFKRAFGVPPSEVLRQNPFTSFAR